MANIENDKMGDLKGCLLEEKDEAWGTLARCRNSKESLRCPVVQFGHTCEWFLHIFR